MHCVVPAGLLRVYRGVSVSCLALYMCVSMYVHVLLCLFDFYPVVPVFPLCVNLALPLSSACLVCMCVCPLLVLSLLLCVEHGHTVCVYALEASVASIYVYVSASASSSTCVCVGVSAYVLVCLHANTLHAFQPANTL